MPRGKEGTDPFMFCPDVHMKQWSCLKLIDYLKCAQHQLVSEWQALYMDFIFYYSETDKIYVLLLSSFYRWEIDVKRGSVTCDYVHCWNQMIESRFKPGNPIPGLVSNSSGKGWEFRVRIVLLMVAFLTWDVSPLTLTSCGLYIFSSLTNWSVLVQPLRMPTQRLF